MRKYRYIGDRFTDPALKGQLCQAVEVSGKCIRGKNGNMLVQFGNKKVVVVARLLRKVISVFVISILFATCSAPRDIADPYSMVVTVISVRPAAGGTMVTIRYKYMLYRRLFIQLPDSVTVGKTLVIPIFKRIS
jgi:hypothetical protein